MSLLLMEFFMPHCARGACVRAWAVAQTYQADKLDVGTGVYLSDGARFDIRNEKADRTAFLRGKRGIPKTVYEDRVPHSFKWNAGGEFPITRYEGNVGCGFLQPDDLKERPQAHSAPFATRNELPDIGYLFREKGEIVKTQFTRGVDFTFYTELAHIMTSSSLLCSKRGEAKSTASHPVRGGLRETERLTPCRWH
jgi:hypothetical protein